MNHLALEQRFQIVEINFQNRSFFRETHRALTLFYGRYNRPSEQAIRSLMDKFRTTYSLHDVGPPTRQRNVRTEKATQPPKLEVHSRFPITRFPVTKPLFNERVTPPYNE